MNEKIKEGLIKANHILIIFDNMNCFNDPMCIEQMRLIQERQKHAVLVRNISIGLEKFPEGLLVLVDADFTFTTEKDRENVFKDAIIWIIQHDDPNKKYTFLDGQTGEKIN
jgi:hypothetical protein